MSQSPTTGRIIKQRSVPRKGTKILILERANPEKIDNQNKQAEINRHESMAKGAKEHRIWKTSFELIANSLRKDADVHYAEWSMNQRAKELMNKAMGEEDYFRDRFFKAHSFQDFKEILPKLVESNRVRDNHLLEEIKKMGKNGKVEVRYGHLHSLVRKNLEQQGIRTSIEMKKIPFTHFERAARKLWLGKELSPLEYKRAYLSAFIDYGFGGFLGKILFGSFKEPTHSRLHFTEVAQNTIVDCLSEANLDRIISTRNPFLAFEYAGLPNPNNTSPQGMRKAVIQLMEQKSEYWKRRKIIQEIKQKKTRG